MGKALKCEAGKKLRFFKKKFWEVRVSIVVKNRFLSHFDCFDDRRTICCRVFPLLPRPRGGGGNGRREINGKYGGRSACTKLPILELQNA